MAEFVKARQVSGSGLTVPETKLADVAELESQVLEFVKSRLFPGVDYGVIPGTDGQKVLFQRGMQKICSFLGVYQDPETQVHDLGKGHREYLVKTRLRTMGEDIVLAVGEGSCCTLESKYRYKSGKRVCPGCGSAAIIKTKRNQWWCPKDKGGCGANYPLGDPEITRQSTERTENPDPADQYNTVLKMANKRSAMAALRNISGGIWAEHFAQEEDLDEHAAAAAADNAKEGAGKPALTVAEIRLEIKGWPVERKNQFETHRSKFQREGKSRDEATLLAYEKVTRPA